MRSYATDDCPIARREMQYDERFMDVKCRLSKNVSIASFGDHVTVSKIMGQNLFHAFAGNKCRIFDSSYLMPTPELMSLLDEPTFEVDE